jgi:phosphatidylinositol-4-phosphate 3-kinase
MYSTTETVNSDPVYAAVDKSTKSPAISPAAPPPLPPRNSSAWNTIERRRTSLDRRVIYSKITNIFFSIVSLLNVTHIK